jgi:hypothetical protein
MGGLSACGMENMKWQSGWRDALCPKHLVRPDQPGEDDPFLGRDSHSLQPAIGAAGGFGNPLGAGDCPRDRHQVNRINEFRPHVRLGALLDPIGEMLWHF